MRDRVKKDPELPDDAQPSRGWLAGAVIVGAIGCVALALGEPFGVMVVKGSPLCADYSAGGAIFVLLIIVLANWVLRKLTGGFGLSGQQLAVVYIMMVVSCAIISWGFVMNLIAVMAGPLYYATPSNHWDSILLPHLPPHLIIQNEAASRLFYEGLGPGQSPPWEVWLAPLAWWMGLALALYLVQVSVAVILRKQWVENERLVFPLTQLPLELTWTEGGVDACAAFLRNPLLWLGLAIPFIFHSLNALHSYFPAVPAISRGWGFSILRRHAGFTVSIFFEVIGLSYLLTSDVALGLWLFPVLSTIEMGLLNLYGINTEPAEYGSDPGTPPIAYQGLGAMALLVGVSLWRGRDHLRSVFREAWHGGTGSAQAQEALSYRAAVFGGAAGLVVVLWWLVRSGMNLATAVFFVIVALLILVGLARVVSQAGIAYGRPPVAAPVMTFHGLGSDYIGPAGVGALALSFAWAGDIRTSVAASTANALKIATAAKLPGRPVRIALGTSIIVPLVASSWFSTRMAYAHGGLKLGGWHMQGLARVLYTWIARLMQTGVPTGIGRFGYMGWGGLLYLLIAHLHDTYAWFPVHPIGLTLGLAGPVAWVWFSVFLAWLLKAAILRYGGARTYQRARPFFLGMVLGSFTAAGMWIIIDAVAGGRGNAFTLT